MSHDRGLMIRRAQLPDAEAIANLHNHGWLAYRGMLPDGFLDDPAGWRACEQRWQRQLADAEAGVEQAVEVWVAETDDQVVGFITIGPTLDADVPKGTMEIWDLWVDRDRRSYGVGKALVRQVLSSTTERVAVWVLAANRRGRAFYEREGAHSDRLQRTERIEASDLHPEFDMVDVRLSWPAREALG